MISLKDITIDFLNKNKNNQNQWIKNRWITKIGASKKKCRIYPKLVYRCNLKHDLDGASQV
jgi:hypothetical protein